MFLRGVFSHNVQAGLSKQTLGQISTYVYNNHLPSVVRNSLYELVNIIEKGTTFHSTLGIIKYSWGITKNGVRTMEKEKRDHNEFALESYPEDGTGLPYRTIDQDGIAEQDVVKDRETVSWHNLLGVNTFEALDFRDELEENIDTYNTVCSYFEDTYGFNFKTVFRFALDGVSESEKYLMDIFEKENDQEFIDTLAFLAQFEEFNEYIHSDRKGELTID